MLNIFFRQYTPLYMATLTSSHDAVRYLPDKGADVNIKSYKGVS